MEAQIQPRVLTEEEKQRLRKERFNSGENVTTVEAQRVKLIFKKFNFYFLFRFQKMKKEKFQKDRKNSE